MYTFKNLVLQREYKELLSDAISLERGGVGGYSIEIETLDPKSFDSFVYNGGTAEKDREHDFLILEKIFNEKTTD
jgi:hypothetical protein